MAYTKLENLIDYYYFNNYLSKSEIVNLNKFIESNYTCKEPVSLTARDSNGKTIKNSDVFQIEYHKIKDKLNTIVQDAYNVGLRQFGYDLTHPNDLDHFHLNVYSSKKRGEYKTHYDSSNSNMWDIKLTLLVNVSLKKYEGGDFEYLNSQFIRVKELENPGSVLIFKSHFHHRVLPVTSGERRTLTHFMLGPRFR